MRCVVAAICVLSAVSATAKEPEDMARYQEPSKQIAFATMFETPDVLDPAIVPYVLCVNPQGRDVPNGTSYDPASYDAEPDCSAERETAKADAIAILGREGVETPALQEVLIGETLYVIDLQAKAMALYTSERRYGGEE